MSRSAARLLVSLALLALAAVPASAQYIYGASEILLNTGAGAVYGHSVTALDYVACYYYDAAVAGGLYEDSTRVSGGSHHGVCDAHVYTSGTIHDDRIYTEVSDHYVIAYYYYQDYGYYDPFGVSKYSSGGSGGGFSFYGCNCPYYVIQASFYLGSTQIGIQGPCNRTPTLGGPSPVTRGSDATYTVGNLCRTYTVRDWKFIDSNNNIVNRGSSGATSWPGKMVQSGTVQATVVQGGRTYPLSKSVTVDPRTSFAFTARPATKQTNGTFSCDGATLVVPDPPTQTGQAIGMYSTCLRYSFTFNQVGDQGPNRGFWYVISASDSASGMVPPATTFAWTITPQLDNPGSAFYQAQCGRDGFISGAQLRANTAAHESGSVNSHYSRYVAAQNNPANNVGTGLEAIVGPPSESMSGFQARAQQEGNARQSRIISAAQQEPCGASDVTRDESCVSYGRVNYLPYQACSSGAPPAAPGSGSGVGIYGAYMAILFWSDLSSNEDGFRIERQFGGSFFTVSYAGPNSTSGIDPFVVPGSFYTYRIVAYNAWGEAASSPFGVFVP